MPSLANCQSIRYVESGEQFDPFLGRKEFTESQLVLVTTVDGGLLELGIGRFFKLNYGRLTKARRDFIQMTMPTTIEIVLTPDHSGYIPKESELNAWMNRIRHILDSIRTQ